MPDIIPDSINHYAEQFTSSESELLIKINRETNLETDQPVMLSGKLQGRFLSMISRMLQPKRILEIGTFTGYSALCLSEGLQEAGELHTIDNNEELAERCKRYFYEAGMHKKIILHTGEALDIIPSLAGPFDLVFIDADKPNYKRYFELVLDKIPSGGIILADNVLYHGEVLLDENKRSHNGKAISSFNEMIVNDDRVEQVLLTLRDGLFMVRKK